MSYALVSSRDDEDDDIPKGGLLDEESLDTVPLEAETRSRWALFALTCTVGGLQVVWSVILSNGVPRLISLGLSKSMTAIVWIAGPVCGTVVQPYLGLKSDQCRLHLGRRRPFIIVGAIGIILSILMLGWIEDLVCGLTAWAKRDGSSPHVQVVIIVSAVLSIYILNFSLQALQMGIRALIVDFCPQHQQSQASSWSATMTGFGNVIGYAVGFSKIPDMFPCISQFQGLCIVASVVVAVTVAITCFFVSERKSVYVYKDSGIASIFRDLRQTYVTMPGRIRKVCHIQMWAWMAWYPFLFYSTTFVSEIYSQTESVENVQKPSGTNLSVEEEGTRLGTWASFMFAIVSLLSNALLPWFTSLYERYLSRGTRIGERLVTKLWTGAHVLFASLMLSSNFVTGPSAGTAIIAITGLSWALTLWAPFAIIGKEIRSTGAEGQAVDARAATILSLHNIAISVPQVIAALVCSAIFAVAQAMNVSSGTQWAFGLGAVAALRAAWLTVAGLDS